MKIAFFGTPVFAAKILEHLVLNAQQHEIVAVISKPDKPKGRGQHCHMTPVHEMASSLLPNVPYMQPQKASSIETIEQLRAIGADIFVVVAYGEIVTKAILDMPRYGCVNVHASLLPLLRGAAPIQRAIMQGFLKTGVTIMRMAEGMDTGDMIITKEVSIGENDLVGTVQDRLLEAAKIGLVHALDAIENGTVVYRQQEHSLATKANKITELDLCLDANDDVRKLHNTIRALSPKPGAYFQISLREKFVRLKVLESRVGEECSKTPTFQTRECNLVLVNSTGSLVIQELQLEGKARIASKEFLKGYPLPKI